MGVCVAVGGRVSVTVWVDVAVGGTGVRVGVTVSVTARRMEALR